GRLVGAELLGPAGSELLVSFVVQTVEPTGMTQEQSILRRYSWHGELLGEFAVAGRASRLSPDGRLLVAGQDLQHLTRGVLVTDVATGQPLFRVAGVGSAGWMAGGAGLVLQGEDGFEYVVSTAGALSPAPRTPPGGQLVFDGSLAPAPGDAHRFLVGLAVVNESGTVLQRIDLPTDKEWLIRDTAWGAGDDEVVIMISPPVGKGHIGFDFPLAPVVQRLPFPEPYLLTVQDPGGECVNLRESHVRESRVIRCLPTGTGLAVGDLQQLPEKVGATYFDDGHLWLWARTEQGETGWVALDTGSVGWR
ncbi:MAG TPA: hypothetical protein VK464_27295, partial [Symbiobacteriaceae bacterium]|nr:hypothetical protein [Symbiobacteriaceae bacterium]